MMNAPAFTDADARRLVMASAMGAAQIHAERARNWLGLIEADGQQAAMALRFALENLDAVIVSLTAPFFRIDGSSDHA